MEDEVYDGIDHEEIELEEILQEQKVEKVDGHLRFKKWNNFRRAERNKRISDSKSRGASLAKWINVALEYFDNRCALSGEEFVEFEDSVRKL